MYYDEYSDYDNYERESDYYAGTAQEAADEVEEFEPCECMICEDKFLDED